MATAVIQAEGNQVDYTPGSAVAAGDVIVQGELVGVAPVPIAANVLGALTVEGIVKFPKAVLSTSAITAGALCYWDAGNVVATTTAGANKLLGKCVTAAAAADTTVSIKLDQ